MVVFAKINALCEIQSVESVRPIVSAQLDLFGLPHYRPSVHNTFDGSNRAQKAFNRLKKAKSQDPFLLFCGCSLKKVNRTDVEVCLIGA